MVAASYIIAMVVLLIFVITVALLIPVLVYCWSRRRCPRCQDWIEAYGCIRRQPLLHESDVL